MKQYKDEIFGVIPQPGSFSELLELIHSWSEKGFDPVKIWRGQSDIRWPIHSSAYRRLQSSKKATLTDNALIHYEASLLERATHLGYRDLDGKILQDFELLARLQHHGAATRLVDATRNVLVGLYFAIIGNPDEVGALFGFHTDFLGGSEGTTSNEAYSDAMKDLPKYTHPQTWQPTHVSPRIAAQHAQFLYSAVCPNKTGSLWVDSDPKSLLVVAITPSLKKQSKTILSNHFDIRHLTLFPDLDGFAFANSQQFDQWDSYRW